MKQLKDGGVAFYRDSLKSFKKALKALFPTLIGILIGGVLIIYFKSEVSPFARCLEFCICYLAACTLALGIITLCFKLTPNCTIYNEHIVWKDDAQGHFCAKEKKYFLKDLQSFCITPCPVFWGQLVLKGKGIWFNTHNLQEKAAVYPWFSFLSEQDQKLLIELLKDKGLTHLPGDYKPN